MAVLKKEELNKYLSSVLGKPVKIISLGGMPQGAKELDLKGYGFGKPVLIEYEVGGQRKKAVLETLREDSYGHDFLSDRAASLILAHLTYQKLAKHVSSIDVGFLTKKKKLIPIGEADEVFIINEFVEGKEYYQDLDRIRDEEAFAELDLKRALALSDYLVRIHKKKKHAPELYTRRIRDLVGHGECIMGIIDGYPLNWKYVAKNIFKTIEKDCVDWRWKLKDKEYRLSVVHGDFHPWNILFKNGESADFWVLDRSRGEWGEPADDVSAMSINYIFYSLQKYGKLKEEFKQLFDVFMKNYLEKTQDEELLEVIQPFYAWRGLVIASPVWYPNLPETTRKKLFNFVINILESKKFNLRSVNRYLEKSTIK